MVSKTKILSNMLCSKFNQFFQGVFGNLQKQFFLCVVLV